MDAIATQAKWVQLDWQHIMEHIEAGVHLVTRMFVPPAHLVRNSDDAPASAETGLELGTRNVACGENNEAPT